MKSGVNQSPKKKVTVETRPGRGVKWGGEGGEDSAKPKRGE